MARRIGRLLGLGVLLAGWARAGEWQVRVQPARIQQGGLVFVELEGQARAARPSCEWLGRTYALYPSEGGYRAILPVDRLQRAGPARLVVRAEGQAEPLASRRLFITRLKTGPARIIRLTPDRMALLEDPRLEEESRRIREIIGAVSPRQLWQGNFQPPSDQPAHNFGRMRRYVEIRGGKRRSAGSGGHHRGLDFGLEEGTPVKAANAGRVLAAQPFVLPATPCSSITARGL